MRSGWHIVTAVLALVSQLVFAALLWVFSVIAYANWALLPESWEWPVSLVLVASFAVVSFVLGGVGVYGLLTRSRLGTAVVLIAACCIPALLGGAVYLHALLVFLTLV